MENQMLGTKITCPRVGQHENNSPKDRESNVRNENNSPKVGQYKNNSPKGWTDGELNERIENNTPYCLTPDCELNEQLKK